MLSAHGLGGTHGTSIPARVGDLSDLRRLSGLFGHPLHDRISHKSPLIANPKARDLTLPRRLIHRGRVYAQHFAKLLERQNFFVIRHKQSVLNHSR